jgi:hypothetical protein
MIIIAALMCGLHFAAVTAWHYGWVLSRHSFEVSPPLRDLRQSQV